MAAADDVAAWFCHARNGWRRSALSCRDKRVSRRAARTSLDWAGMKRTQQRSRRTRDGKRRAADTTRPLEAKRLAAVRGGAPDDARRHASRKVDIHENQHNETLMRL